MRSVLTLLLVYGLAANSFGQDDSPPFPESKPDHRAVAIRWWGQGMVSLETWWNLTVVIDPFSDKIGYEVPGINGDLVLVTHDHADHNNVKAIKGDPRIVYGPTDTGNEFGGRESIYHFLIRLPNDSEVQWLFNGKADRHLQQEAPAITVDSINAWHDDSEGSERGATAMFVLEVDGLRIVHCGDLGQSKLTDYQLQSLNDIDVLLLPVGGVYTIGGAQAWGIVEQVKPRIVVPIHYKTDDLKIPLEPVDKFVRHMPPGWELEKPSHNTLAVSTSKSTDNVAARKLVVLDYHPWEPTGELADLLKKMDSACQASQKVFEPLSANQMNWRPPNGTHTPRWNAEHMLARQLQFFTEIYAERDAALSVIDLNPKQMPDDYAPAHPDWTGAEEARQMERANAYVRRFAYLLEGIDIQTPAPGSRWNLDGLLKQMERHFAEHTANVKQKLELSDWPET